MLYQVDSLDQEHLEHLDILPENNDCFEVHNHDKTYLFRFYDGEFHPIKLGRNSKIKGLFNDHYFFQDMMEDDEVKIISLVGAAGCGKTFMALGCALEAVQQERFEKVMVVRELVPATKWKTGYLPGNLHEKISPMFASIYDNIESLKRRTRLFGRDPMVEAEDLINQGIIEISTLEYMRGRSLENCVIIVEECQNMSIDNLRLIITRLGEGTKIIFNGDPSQIDDYTLQTTGQDYLSRVCSGRRQYGEIEFTHSEARSGIVAEFLKWEKDYLHKNG